MLHSKFTTKSSVFTTIDLLLKKSLYDLRKMSEKVSSTLLTNHAVCHRFLTKLLRMNDFYNCPMHQIWKRFGIKIFWKLFAVCFYSLIPWLRRSRKQANQQKSVRRQTRVCCYHMNFIIVSFFLIPSISSHFQRPYYILKRWSENP